ncbi:UDP-N-acetylmuramoyl-tripeptide--D-alanyl-D-alanine ligase [Dethiosulfatarculus sandiegensis]|uniref:UDP-N-acetylmuramoyl-tripeptide--D-alanyl-D-alanine ligase n=1 Tax=Dethiosulfatarculus sandiegensis TaxID=1429043 RepID=A0A0D2JH72_9BACT|nr:UDP-N-acetylmuramoyl-tripeptide--D-alanyl-D-alanine ligase [Dethiosulfatarculus sandiegensis]KIX15081.1 UDP-N-acetylmuramoyl-tripeptide--D-alanyl-D-alanine ligase [Dethiosulfatarculus sandiegensis]
MPELNFDFVKNALRAEVRGKLSEKAFSKVSTDTRDLPQGSLFVALKGENFDAHDFVADALKKGAAACVVRKGFELPDNPDACLFQVPDTLFALGELATAWRSRFSLPVAAVTGSNGKTTSKEMLASILSSRSEVLKNKGNFNNLIGLPLTLLGLSPLHKICVVEMGMNAPGEIKRLTQIAVPDVGVITNVGAAHLGPMGSLEAVAKAKAELFEGLGDHARAVVNIDDPLLAPWAEKMADRAITFGMSEKAQVSCRDISALGTRQAFNLVLPEGVLERVRLAAPGSHNVKNALAAAATAWAMGFSAEEIKKGLEGFAPVRGRLHYQKSMWGYAVVDDTYNANPSSLQGGLEALGPIASGRPKGLILGDMLELGPDAPRLHEKAGRMAVEAGCNLVMALGGFAPQVAKGAQEAGLSPDMALAFDDFMELVEASFEVLTGEEVVLIKGSRAMRMERVVKALVSGEIS